MSNGKVHPIPFLQVVQENRVTVFNGTPWCWSELVRIPVKEGMVFGEWRDTNDTLLEAQLTNDVWYVMINDLPSFGFLGLTFTDSRNSVRENEEFNIFVQKPNGISTPFYEIMWNSYGQLIRIYDKVAKREVLNPHETGNVFQVFEDKPKSRHEAWDIDIFYQEKMKIVDGLKHVTVLSTGALRATVQFEWNYMDSVIRQTMILYKESRRIDFETEVDWYEQRQLLKVAFPVNIRATEAIYDIQFGNVKRPTHWNTIWDYAKFETIGHQWADLSERTYGVSLLNDCKYGYDIKENVLRQSLIKSALVPDPTANQGKHEFTYSLLPHLGDWFDGRTVIEAWALNQPPNVVYGNAPEEIFSLFSLSLNNVMLDAIKKEEDEDLVVLRLHEFGGIRGDLEISSDLPILWWQECNLLELPETERHEQSTVLVPIKPYEIKSFLIKFL